MVDYLTMRTHWINQEFLLKAFGHIERVVKSDFFSETTYFTSYLRNIFWATILYKYYDIFPHTLPVTDTREGVGNNYSRREEILLGLKNNLQIGELMRYVNVWNYEIH